MHTRIPSAEKVALLRRFPSGKVQALSKSDGETIYDVFPEREPSRANPSCTCPAGIVGHQCYHWRCAREKFLPQAPVPSTEVHGPRRSVEAEAEAIAAAAEAEAIAAEAPAAQPVRTPAQRARALLIAATLAQGQAIELADLVAVADHLAAYIVTGRLPV